MPGFDAILLTERDTNVFESRSTGSRSPRCSRDTPVACRRRAPSAPGWHRGNVRGVGLVSGAKRKERSGMSENVDKVNEDSASRGEMGQRYLASGEFVSMRLWDAEEHGDPKPEAARAYETVGYVIGKPSTAVEATSPPAEAHGCDEP